MPVERLKKDKEQRYVKTGIDNNYISSYSEVKQRVKNSKDQRINIINRKDELKQVLYDFAL